MLIPACSTFSKPAPIHKYYILDEMPSVGDSDLVSVILIKNILVPDYLKQRNLILRQKDQQIAIANHHSWADDLVMSIQRVLTKELSRDTERFQRDKICINCFELTINIDHFYPTESGSAFLAGSYSLSNLKSKAQSSQHFSFESALGNDGYAEAVYQMRQMLSLLGNDIKLSILKLS